MLIELEISSTDLEEIIEFFRVRGISIIYMEGYIMSPDTTSKEKLKHYVDTIKQRIIDTMDAAFLFSNPDDFVAEIKKLLRLLYYLVLIHDKYE